VVWSMACEAWAARRWILRIPLWDLSTSGGRVDAGNGMMISRICLNPEASANFERDVAAGFAILEEAGGLVTTANPPSDPETADITRAHLGGRLYLAIR
jgi:hypothetical protein